MKRLRLFILCAGAVVALGVATYLAAADDQHDHQAHGGAAQKAESGPSSNATVSFGAWRTSPPVDRFPNRSDTRTDNLHAVIPEVAQITAGGTVNFIIAGFHQVIVYDDGTRPEDINTSITVLPTTTPPTPPPPLIADPNRRLYRGPDPSLQPADRVEVVHFAEPGTYLVICGVLPHFEAGMYGYVRVVSDREAEVREGVRQTYLRCACREPDPGGWDHWTQEILAGRASYEALCQALAANGEQPCGAPTPTP